LYPATLLKLFMVFRSFLVEFLGSFRYKIMLSANRNSLTTSFPIVFLLFLPGFLSLLLLICCITSNDLCMLNHPYILGWNWHDHGMWCFWYAVAFSNKTLYIKAGDSWIWPMGNSLLTQYTFFFFVVLGLKLRAYTSSYSTNSFLWWVFSR
jgi:hypothetical protein